LQRTVKLRQKNSAVRSALDERAGEVAEERPNPVAGVEERLAKKEHAEKDHGHDEGEEGPGPDVELVVGRRLGAHGGNMNEEVRTEK